MRLVRRNHGLQTTQVAGMGDTEARAAAAAAAAAGGGDAAAAAGGGGGGGGDAAAAATNVVHHHGMTTDSTRCMMMFSNIVIDLVVLRHHTCFPSQGWQRGHLVEVWFIFGKVRLTCHSLNLGALHLFGQETFFAQEHFMVVT